MPKTCKTAARFNAVSAGRRRVKRMTSDAMSASIAAKKGSSRRTVVPDERPDLRSSADWEDLLVAEAVVRGEQVPHVPV